eukprot:g21000.t1
MQTLAQRAIAVLDSAEDDVVFCSGFKADATYFAINGALCYVRTGATPSSLSSEQWVAEMCLWTDWYHVGDLLSISFAKLVAINVEEFCAIIGSAGTVQAQAHEYAISFVDALNQQLDLSDLWRMSPPKARPLNVKERWHASFSNSGDTDRASTRVLRLLRLFRVVRLGKLTRFAAFLRDKFETQVASIQFSLVLIIMGMMLLEHVIACGWFGVGQLEAANGMSWLIKSNLIEETFYKQYTASLSLGCFR